MRAPRSRYVTLLLLAAMALTGRLFAQEPETRESTAETKSEAKPKVVTDSGFTRFVKESDESAHFDTAIASFEDDQGRKVDLIGAVHIADTSYYTQLQKIFAGYDAVLYELVAPKGTIPEPGRKSAGFVSTLQRSMKTALKLDFQLDAVDYSPENFVHADLSPEEFEKLQEERGESIWSFMIDMMIQAMRNPDLMAGKEASVMDLLKALFTKDGHNQLKLILAQQLDGIEEMMAGMGKGTVLIHERNKAALAVLDDQLSNHPQKKKLAIFYGAAHLPDFEKKLEERGFKRKSTRWLTAWQIGEKPKKL